MFAVPAFFIGVLIGWWRARKMGGKVLDQLQYAAIHGLVFFLIALVLTVIADWQGWV